MENESGQRQRFGFENAVKKLGGEITFTDANYDPKKQSDQIEAFIKMKPDALFVTPSDPAGINAAVKRKSSSGQVVGPEEAVDVMEAIRVYTINGAYVGKDEDSLGSIEPGKLADLAILDTDILACDPADIAKTKVLTTIVDGRVVYPRE